MANKSNKNNKINKETQDVETARDKGVSSTDWLGVSEYTYYLKRIITATERSVKRTDYEFHKGGLKAYKDSLNKFDRFISSHLENH